MTGGFIGDAAIEAQRRAMLAKIDDGTRLGHIRTRVSAEVMFPFERILGEFAAELGKDGVTNLVAATTAHFMAYLAVGLSVNGGGSLDDCASEVAGSCCCAFGQRMNMLDITNPDHVTFTSDHGDALAAALNGGRAE